jgi:hypothetical protein
MKTQVGCKRLVRIAAWTGMLLAGAAVTAPAGASTVTLNGSGQMYWTAQFEGTSSGNAQTTPTGSYGNNYALSVPGQYSFLDSFSQQTNNLTGPGTTSSVGPYAFQDTYVFSLSQAAQGDALVVSLNLGQSASTFYDISDLQFRLYEVPSSTTQPGLSIPTGSTIIQSWMGTSGPSSGNPVQASFSNVQSGTYFLDIAGIADGSLGGGYVGQLNLAPVPLPGALWLMISGIGLLGITGRGRSSRFAGAGSGT